MRGCQDCYNSLSIFSWPVGTQGENRLALYFPPVKLPCQQCCRYLLLNYQLQSSDLETQQLQLQLPRFLWEEKFGSDLVWAWQSAPGQVIIIEFENWNYQSVSLWCPGQPGQWSHWSHFLPPGQWPVPWFLLTSGHQSRAQARQARDGAARTNLDWYSLIIIKFWQRKFISRQQQVELLNDNITFNTRTRSKCYQLSILKLIIFIFIIGPFSCEKRDHIAKSEREREGSSVQGIWRYDTARIFIWIHLETRLGFLLINGIQPQAHLINSC